MVAGSSGAGSAKALYPRRLGRAPMSVVRLVAVWCARGKARRQLAALDDRLARDIGVSPFDIRREIIKPFWSA